MSIPLDQLPVWDRHERLQAIIETPKGSRLKYKFDPESGQIRLDKVLPPGMSFPLNFGFIPSTKDEDGDPLDVVIVMDEPAFPGCIVSARLLGIIEAEQTEKGQTIRNDRLIAVLDTPRNPSAISSLDELGSEQLDGIELFFISYNQAEDRTFKPIGRHGIKKARKIVAKGEKQ